MKIRKDGTLALQKGERRAGNFVVALQETHVRVTAVSGVFSMRIARHIQMGTMLAEAHASADERTLHLLCSWLFKVGCIVPDTQAMAAVTEIYNIMPARMQRRQGNKAALYPTAQDMEERMLRLLPAMGVDIDDTAFVDTCKDAVRAHYGRRADWYRECAEDIGVDRLREFYDFIHKKDDTDSAEAVAGRSE